MDHLHPDYKEFIELLNENDVEYLIVGAMALAWHGVPRFTGDIDILVRPNSTNGQRLITVLKKFGFNFDNLSASDFSVPHQVIQLGHPPVRIDLLTSLSGVSWEEAREGEIEISLHGVNTRIISRDHLIANKRATGRTQDLADIERLEDSESS